MYILELCDVEEQGTEFCFRKLKFNTIYDIYLNKEPMSQEEQEQKQRFYFSWSLTLETKSCFT